MPTSTSTLNRRATASKSHIMPRPKKTRVVRRRGRAQGGLDSDEDEIEREVGTDESDTDHPSLSSASDSDSDTEPASDDVQVPQDPHVITATDSTRRIDVNAIVPVKEHSVAPPAHPSFFAPTEDWSEMVTEEDISGPADLPVIDFQDFNGQITHLSPSRASTKKSGKKYAVDATSASLVAPTMDDVVEEQQEEEMSASSRQRSTTFVRRAPGQTARQAYQQRLESDPSYVPTVGEFWGHDDRLLDKDLRSLSGWWRGRWRGGPRGRGIADRSVRGRGRGGSFIGLKPQLNGELTDSPLDPHEADVAPIDRAWTHDGFEEMKRREQQAAARGGFRGGRGGYAAVRGGRGGARGFAAPLRGRAGAPFTASTNRTWVTAKPERMWTKHHEAFLYQDQSTKSSPSQNLTIRVKLSQGSAAVVHAPRFHRQYQAKRLQPMISTAPEKDEQPFVVRIPLAANNKPSETPASNAIFTNDSAEDVEEVFKVRPHLAVPHPIPLPLSTSPTISETKQSEASISAVKHSSPLRMISSLPQPEIVQKLEQLPSAVPEIDAERRIQTERAVLRRPSISDEKTSDPIDLVSEQRPVLPPLQTAFPPQPLQQPTPPYGSPYAYPATLPPGIGINSQGVPYEISTGRPVFLQPAAPMYNPRPMMNGPPFMPSHIHHRSTGAPDFFAQHQPSPSHTPPVNSFVDPSTGAPIFSLPRSSRVEIRAPDGTVVTDPSSEKLGRASSFSRLNASTPHLPLQTHHQPSSSTSSASAYMPAVAHPYFTPPVAGGYALPPHPDEQQQHLLDPSVMSGYSSYSQQYYYPVADGGYGADGYGYPQYMDMSHSYDIYPPPSDGTTYY